ncbi:MAG: hypothetical protein JWP12_2826 [Bacteroidetes bacterium]|nr:hypothetical protein [Bacteroidota bacterium]
MSKTSTKKIITSPKTEMNEKIDDKKEFPYEPGNQVINNILNYSKALSVRKSKGGDHFEMVLN